MSDAPITKRGLDLLLDPRQNKSTAFSEAERDAYGLRGLLPPRVFSQDVQVERAIGNLRRKHTDLEKFIFLRALHGRNERLFYRLVLEHLDEMLPLIYTPTVGQACLEFASIFRQTQGLYITANDLGRVDEILGNWPRRNVSVIVVTDGERILGLGDLGANGMGIPIGKLALYSALAGVPPDQTLPIMLDVGTENASLRDDPLYLGLDQPRVRGDDYVALVDELVTGVQQHFPGCLIQFEDFATPNAFALLDRFQNACLCFNDDIQGTASVALAGVYASTRITGIPFSKLRIMFLGAGSAATGIGDLIAYAFEDAGLSDSDARRRLTFCDSKGLVVAERTDLQPHNLPYAHDLPPMPFEDAVDKIKPHVLIGATGAPGTFTKNIVQAMARHNDRPVIFALSNPTDRAECTAEQAYTWSQGRAVFASGSPFGAVKLGDQTFSPGQGNNAYIFPGIGLGAIFCKARSLPPSAFLHAARTLSQAVRDADLASGALYPPLSQIREVSLDIAIDLVESLSSAGLATAPLGANWQTQLADEMYEPHY